MHGEKVANPADKGMPPSIAICAPKDRTLSPAEIRLMVHEIDVGAKTKRQADRHELEQILEQIALGA